VSRGEKGISGRWLGLIWEIRVGSGGRSTAETMRLDRFRVLCNFGPLPVDHQVPADPP
jgi:hypothetical protein